MRSITILSILIVALATAVDAVAKTTAKVTTAKVTSPTVKATSPTIKTTAPTPIQTVSEECTTFLDTYETVTPGIMQACIGPFPDGFNAITNSISFLETTLYGYCGSTHQCLNQDILSLLQQLASNCSSYTPEVIETAEAIYKSNIIPPAWCLTDVTGNYCQLKTSEISPDITGNTNETDITILCSTCYLEEMRLAATYLTTNLPSMYPIVGQNITRTIDNVYGKVYNEALSLCGATFVEDLNTPAQLVSAVKNIPTASVLVLIPTTSSSLSSSLSTGSSLPLTGGANSIAAWNRGLCVFTIALLPIIGWVL